MSPSMSLLALLSISFSTVFSAPTPAALPNAEPLLGAVISAAASATTSTVGAVSATVYTLCEYSRTRAVMPIHPPL